MAKNQDDRRERRLGRLTLWISLVSVVISLLSFARSVVETVWAYPAQVARFVQRLQALGSAVTDAPPLHWWALNLRFASATQIGFAALVLWRSRRELCRGSDQRLASDRLFLSDALYYFALVLLARPLGFGEVGQNAALEVINLYLGWALFSLAATLQPPLKRPAAYVYAAPVAIALAVIIDFAPWCASKLGLCSEQAALRELSTWGSTVFVAIAGSVLFCAAKNARAAKRAPWGAVVGLGLYGLGLWARMVFTHWPTLWDSGLAFGYYCSMAGKFCVYPVVRATRPTHLQAGKARRSLLDRSSDWFKRRQPHTGTDAASRADVASVVRQSHSCAASTDSVRP